MHMPPAAEGAMRTFQIVVAAARNMAIGKDGKLPWQLPGDMAYFKELTTRTRDAALQNAVVMGRKTYESIPAKFRPLAGRINVVLSRSAGQDENASGLANAATSTVSDGGVLYSRSLSEALALLGTGNLARRVETVFVIGGGQVYTEALATDLCEAIHLTSVDASISGCDTYFPKIDASCFKLWSASPPQHDAASNLNFTFLCYVRASSNVPHKSSVCATSSSGSEAPPALPHAINTRHEEYQYLDLVRELLGSGVYRGDRTGTGTFSCFGRQMRFNLRHTFPLLTTKRVFWRGVVEELLWFVSGCTNSTVLQDKGIHIWDGNSSREFLDSRGLAHREVGDLGPVYGFQWRHFGAAYTNMHADYTGQGVDQLANVIEMLRTNPSDRRIILSAWNPAALAEMALPPCHMLAQFYVANGELSCLMYQRSADIGLGVPFNIASYALLTRMIAQVCGLRTAEFIHVLGDAHVYANHVEPLRLQLDNVPRPLPVLHLNPARTEIDQFTAADFTLEGYKPHAKIEMKMAI